MANKKKRAEKEAKEREERRRLGIQEPNACKITASQPLLLNFFGAGRKKVDDVRESMEEETEDSEMTQESEASDEDILIVDAEDGRKRDSLSPVQEEEPDLMQSQSQPTKTDDKTNDTTNCLSEEFSDLATELGDDWLDDPELEKHMASMENTQQSLRSSAATHNDQSTEPVQVKTNDWAGLTESFEDDTSLMLQTLDPTVLEKFETTPPKVVLKENNTAISDTAQMSQHGAASSTSVSNSVASNAMDRKAHCEDHRVNDLTTTNSGIASTATNLHTSTPQPPRDIKPQCRTFAQKQQSKNTATRSNINNPTIHNTSPAFKKPVIAVSTQPNRHDFSPKKSVSQSTKVYPTQIVHRQPQFDAEDEFGDLPLSTQDVRDLDSMVGLG